MDPTTMSWLWIHVFHCWFISVYVLAERPTNFQLTDFRLIPKSRPNAGIVEGYAEGVGWGIMCGADGFFVFDFAEKICSRLNFPGTALKLSAAHFQDVPEFASGTLKFSCSTSGAQGGPICSVLSPDSQCDPNRVAAVTCKEPGYLGCHIDHQGIFFGTRVLDSSSYEGRKTNNITGCLDFCRSGNFFYAGVEYADECFCGPKSANFSQFGNVSDSQCNSLCAGDPKESCGGSDRIGVYQVDLGLCSDPGVPINGSLIATPGSGPYRYGSTVSFTCSGGLFLVGRSSLQCVGVGMGDEGVGNDAMSGRSQPEGSNTPQRLEGRHAVHWSDDVPECVSVEELQPTQGVATSLPMKWSEMKSSDESPISQERNDNNVKTTYIIVGVSCVALVILVVMVISISCHRSRRRSKMSTSGTAEVAGCRLDDDLTTPSSLELTVRSTHTGNNYDVVGIEALERPLCLQEADGEPRQPVSGGEGNGAGASRDMLSPTENEINPSLTEVYENSDFHEVPLMEENELYGS